MGAARYVGRLGGLAVALGVGTAVFVGQGVALADAGSGASGASAKAGSPASSRSNAASERVIGSGAGHKTSGRGNRRSDVPTSRGTDGRGRHRTASGANSTNDAARADSADTPADDASADPTSSALAPLQAAKPSPAAATVLAIAKPAPQTVSKPAGKTSPSVAALIGTTISEALSDLTGSAPSAPSTGSPVGLMLLAAVRRDLQAAIDPPASAAQATAPRPAASTAIGYDPTLAIIGGILTGTNTGSTTANGHPLTYHLVSGAADGGKIMLNAATGSFTVLPYQTALASGSETYKIMAVETTAFDSALTSIPIIGGIAEPVLLMLHQTPGLSTLLAPLIGTSTVVPVTITPSAVNTTGDPIAYTVKVTSFDGTQISTNFFPAHGLTAGQTAPTILAGPGGGTKGITDPAGDSSGEANMALDNGYNFVSWDPRGVGASTGLSNLDNVQFEGRDVSAIISYLATLPSVQLDAPGDPRIGMVGQSLGGAIQLVAASIDPRIDAIAPEITWNSMPLSINPYPGAFRSSFTTLLTLLLSTTTRTNPLFYRLILTGALTGSLTGPEEQFLNNIGAGVLAGNITAPTLILSGTDDEMFPLSQAVMNQQYLTASGVPVKMVWYCGGHGPGCSTNPGDDPDFVQQETLAWFGKYLKQETVDTGPAFEWVDQDGNYYSSDVFPTDPSFQGTPISSTGTGGVLPIVPLIGGSGTIGHFAPSLEGIVASFYSLAGATPAKNAVNVQITDPTPTATNPTGTTQVVGAPTLTMSYSGVGTGKVVYAQIVDKTTGLVVGNTNTPIPVTLDGQQHTVTLPLNDIAYTMSDTSDLELQIVSFATAWANLTQFGAIKVSQVQLELPTAANPTEQFPTTSGD
jgi:ABC-2 type transport system ATP-binding protein